MIPEDRIQDFFMMDDDEETKAMIGIMKPMGLSGNNLIKEKQKD